jgi:hypothetical protein
MLRSRFDGSDFKDNLQIFEGFAIEYGSGKSRAIGGVVAVSVCEINQPIFGKLRVERYIHQSPLSAGKYGRNATNWGRIEDTISHDSDSPRTLGDEHGELVRQPSHTPGIFQAADYWH